MLRTAERTLMPGTPHDSLRANIWRTRLAVLVLAVICAIVLPTTANAIGIAPSLGTAESFAVLAGSTVTNTGVSVMTGDLGVSPGSAVTGFPPGLVVGGTIHVGDAVAAQAQSDASAAFTDLAGQACDTDLTGQDLGGLTLTAGVYCFDTSAQLTGTLTLDAEGSPDAVFIFQIGSTLTTASGSSVVLINQADTCNVFFQVGSSATLGTGTAFSGNILALTSITANTGATVDGRLLALNGAVTLDTNLITAPGCTSGGTTDGTTTDGTATDGTTTDGTTTDGTATDGTTTDGTATDGTTGPTITGGAVTRTDLPNTGSNTTVALVGTLAAVTGAAAMSLSKKARQSDRLR